MGKILGYHIVAVITIILFCFCDNNEGVWNSQCWKKHTSGSIPTTNAEFKRPHGVLCTFQCFLWFPPVYQHCEFIFETRLARHFSSLPDCYEIKCNETFSMPGFEHRNY